MRIILAGHIIINILGGSTYFLLNSFLGAGVSFVGIAQSIIMYFYNRKEKRPPLCPSVRKDTWAVLFALRRVILLKQ